LNSQLSGAQVGISLTSLAIGFLAEPSIAKIVIMPLKYLGVSSDFADIISVALGIAIATAITMVFGELIPKNLAMMNPLLAARIIQRPIRLFSIAIKYPIIALNRSANVILKKLGFKPLEDLTSARSADELLSLVRRSAQKGTLSKDVALMLERSLNFGDMTAIEVMTPRVRMHTVPADAPISKVFDIAKSTGLSRFPVYGNNLDDIVGVVHIKHAISIPRCDRKQTVISQIMRPPVLVPSNIQLESLLDALRDGGLQMAIVIDEFGGTDGIVTIEDLFEELVGDVRDEYDRTKAIIRKCNDGSWTFSGLLRPDEISEEIGIFLPEEEDSETIAGLIIDYLERMPRVGDVIQTNAISRKGDNIIVKLQVERMDSHRVDSVRMYIVKSSQKSESKL
jgi:CBS domain containing-hemolysin-like protein